MNKLEFARPMNLTNKIVILDGLTGTGKTMFAPLVGSFEKMQNPCYEYMLEFLLISHEFGKIKKDAAESLLNLMVDVKTYNDVISREVNFRPGDLTSIFKGTKSIKYLRQLFMPDGEEARNRIKNEELTFLIITHQILGCIDIAESSFKKRLKIIEMTRHPLYLLDHWNSYIDMHGNDPGDFTIWLQSSKLVPWFASGWESKYLEATKFDKVIYSIAKLMDPIFDKYDNSGSDNSIVFIPFELFVLNPEPYLEKISDLIGTRITKETERILKVQKVPRKFINLGPQKKIYQRHGLISYDKSVTHQSDYSRLLNSAKAKASAKAFSTLEECIFKYENRFGLWF